MSKTSGSKNTKTSSRDLFVNSVDYFSQENNSTFCEVCQVDIKTTQNHGKSVLQMHMKSEKHQENFIFSNDDTKEDKLKINVHETLVKAFVSSGIPLNTVDNPDMIYIFKHTEQLICLN
ncbi:hypothetical protein A3Q56_02490 [Intoshia linei]|uniref:Uncharacterized protein n=1 Tax=Intoshia linei TaxID=1819745 RepID=A0A177B854_9BILA|nr:hypothetical protein A3Q56_02490 [Intoshia linei]